VVWACDSIYLQLQMFLKSLLRLDMCFRIEYFSEFGIVREALNEVTSPLLRGNMVTIPKENTAER
jgi:hypothetical protein